MKILAWRRMPKNSLLGFATAAMPSGLILVDVAIHSSPRGGGPWASPPARPMIGADGVALRDERGKIRYSAVIEFSDKAVRSKWSDAIISALRNAYPDAIPK